MEAFSQFIADVDGFLWNNILLFVLVGVGIFFTIRTKFVQIRRFRPAWKRVFSGFTLKGEAAGKHGMSSFQALATAIAAQVGTGNIAGCSTALVSGGPGAIFWMWLAAFFGMATIYAEAYMAQKTKTKNEDGEVIGGPVYYIKAAFNNGFGKVLAIIFAILAVFALGFMGCMVQTNSISDAFNDAFSVPKLVTGIILAVIAGFIFIGGLRRIASFTEKIVPIMAAIYLLGGLIVLIINIKNVPWAIGSIFVGAFSPKAVGGAVIGITVRAAMRFGVARGLFSNEAGMGSTPHAHALADVKDPSEQGEVAMIGVFVDTFIVLTMTALVVLSSGVLDGMITSGTTGTPVAQAAFSGALGVIGSPFVAICLLFFAFSTVIGWYFFAEQNVKYLWGKKAIIPFAILMMGFMVLGAVLKVGVVWDLQDLFDGLLVLPNLLALVFLSGIVAKSAKSKKENKMLQ
ncbi:MAG: sodium:alanine symporter family protein [Lachnospiraceae bacterium]|nr:sodium:alanine symporter family protein [Lachnospiraceae bacterium]